jgi:3-oxoacyl-[acyl-carrier protein] reductase
VALVEALGGVVVYLSVQGEDGAAGGFGAAADFGQQQGADALTAGVVGDGEDAEVERAGRGDAGAGHDVPCIREAAQQGEGAAKTGGEPEEAVSDAAALGSVGGQRQADDTASLFGDHPVFVAERVARQAEQGREEAQDRALRRPEHGVEKGRTGGVDQRRGLGGVVGPGRAQCDRVSRFHCWYNTTMDMQNPGKSGGKVAIVTGASRGIGRAIALRLARDGVRVAVIFVRDEEAARATVAEIEAEGGAAWTVQADVSRLGDVRRVFEDVQATWGRLDILVNNAGTATFGPLADVTEEQFDSLFALNVKGVFFAMQEAARRMADGGRIVNISSGVTILGAPQVVLYGGSKGAIEQFTQAASKELGPRSITVNTVSPGMTETDLFSQVVPAEARAEVAEGVPLGRLGQPDDIADVVAFLCSDAGRWVTGQNIRATGGAA